MRVFVDTNVWIAALIARGTCAELVEHVVAQHAPCISTGVVAEIERVLDEKFNYGDERVDEVVEWLEDVAEIVEAPDQAPPRTADGDDDFVLQAALDADAEVLVSGDEDLLEVADDVDLAIVDPSSFWRLG